LNSGVKQRPRTQVIVKNPQETFSANTTMMVEAKAPCPFCDQAYHSALTLAVNNRQGEAILGERFQHFR
jgi:hypothetical protein